MAVPSLGLAVSRRKWQHAAVPTKDDTAGRPLRSGMDTNCLFTDQKRKKENKTKKNTSAAFLYKAPPSISNMISRKLKPQRFPSGIPIKSKPGKLIPSFCVGEVVNIRMPPSPPGFIWEIDQFKLNYLMRRE